MDLELQDKVVVTGGSRGLGAATAERLAREGARVAICGRSRGALDATAERLTSHGTEVAAVEVDVTRPEDLARLVVTVTDRWGRIDGLVNNAGVHTGKPFDQIDPDEWIPDLELKVVAAARLVHLALPALRESRGSVVNVLSTHAKTPGPASMPSSVSRGAGMVLTKGLSRDLAADGVRVNALLVGFIESDQWERRAQKLGRPIDEVTDEMTRRLGVPLGRIGRSEEFADVAAFLLSPGAGYVTGVAMNIDGGLSAAV